MLMKSKTTICRNCNAQIAKDAKNCPSCGAKNKKPFYKRTGFILLMIILVIGVISFIGKNKREKFDWNEVEFCESCQNQNQMLEQYTATIMIH